jgi:hypothetical protein
VSVQPWRKLWRSRRAMRVVARAVVLGMVLLWFSGVVAMVVWVMVVGCGCGNMV